MSKGWRRRGRQKSRPGISQNPIPDGTVKNRQRPSAPEWAVVPPGPAGTRLLAEAAAGGPSAAWPWPRSLRGATERSQFCFEYELHLNYDLNLTSIFLHTKSLAQ